MTPHRQCFHEDITDEQILYNLEHYGCPQEICPGCYCSKDHDAKYCTECTRFVEQTIWKVNAEQEKK